VGPAVISAGKARSIAVIGAAKAIAPMPAHIEKSAHDSVGAAYHEHRVFAHIGREEIAGLRDLAVMAQIEPAAREDALQLLLIDLRLDKDAPADVPAGEIDQLFGGGHRSLRSRSGLTAVRRPGMTMWKAAKIHLDPASSQRGRGMRSIDPASTVRIVPVMPRASLRDARKRYAPARSSGIKASRNGLPPRSLPSMPGL